MTEFQRNLAVIIGINSYREGIQPLQTAAQDARELADILTTHHHYQLIHPALENGSPILNQAATLQQLQQLLTETLPHQVRPTQHDRLLIYFAGHGITRQTDNQGPQGFLVPQDADINNADSLLSMRDLYDYLTQLECRHLLVILDCCFAGMFRWASTRRMVVPNTIHWEHYHRFIKYPAWQVITSAAHNQEALDYLDNRGTGASGKHSPFAEALFQGLLEGKADLISDGVITTPELYLYLRDYVEKRSKEQQTPGFWPLSKHDRGEYIFQLVPDSQLNLEPAPPLEKDNNPYRGLEPFEERHSRFFFGREEVIESLVAHISRAHQQLTIVEGISGSGKSSLVKAGLLPQLRRHQSTAWQIIDVVRLGVDPYLAMATAIASPQASARSLQEISQQLREQPNVFSQLVAEHSHQYPNKKLLLVIDQFEELITLEPRNSYWQTIITMLDNALKICPAFHLIITLRSDFSPRFQNSPLSTRWIGARFDVRPMRSDELREAVLGPANEMALYFEPAQLVDRLVDDVVQTPGALPLLSFTLSVLYMRLYEAWLNEGIENRALSVGPDFEQQGGVAGLLALRASEEYDQLPDEAHRLTMRQVLLRMVEIEGVESVKRRVPVAELIYTATAENKRVETILNRLSQARLIVSGNDAGAAYIELAHDFLVRGWDRLQSWIRLEQENISLQQILIPAAKHWKESKTDLWNGNSRLDRLKQIKRSEQSWFNKLETEFVQRSISRKRRNVQFRWLGFGSLLVASLVTIAVVNAARENAETARQEAERRNVSTLIANSQAAIDSAQFSNALISATQAGFIVQSEPSLSNDETIKNSAITTLYRAYYALGKTLDRSEGSIYSEPVMDMQDVYALPGKAVIEAQFGIAASTEGSVVKIWNIADGELQLEKNVGYQPQRIILLPEKDVLVTIDRSSTEQADYTTAEETTIDFWNIQTGEEVPSSHYLPDAISRHLSGFRVAVIESMILSMEAGLDLEALSSSLGTEALSQFNDVAFSPDLKWLAGFNDNNVVLVNLISDEVIALDTLSTDNSDDSGTSSSEPRSASTNNQITHELVNGIERSVLKRLVVADDIVFGQNGETVTAVGGLNQVKTWSLSGELLATHKFSAQLCNTLPSFGVAPTPFVAADTVSLSSEGAVLAVACRDGTVKLWDIFNSDEWTVPTEIKRFTAEQETGIDSAFSTITFDRERSVVGIENTLNGQTITQFVHLGPEQKVRPTVVDTVVYDFVFSPNSNTIATLDADGYVSIRDRSGLVVQRFLMFEDGYNFSLGNFGGIGDGGLLGQRRPRIVFSPSGELLAIASDKRVKIIRSTGEVIHELDYSEVVENLGFLADQSLVLIGQSAAINVIDRQTGELYSVTTNDGGPTASYGSIHASAVSPDGNFVVFAFENQDNRGARSVQVFNVANQAFYELMSGRAAADVRDLSFDASSSYILIGKSGASRIQMWNVHNQSRVLNEIEVNKKMAIVSSSIHSSKEMIAVTTGQATPGKTLAIETQIVGAGGNILLALSETQLEKVLFSPDSSAWGAIRLKNDGRGTRLDGLLLWDFSLDGLLDKSCDYIKDYLNSPLLSEQDRATCDALDESVSQQSSSAVAADIPPFQLSQSGVVQSRLILGNTLTRV